MTYDLIYKYPVGESVFAVIDRQVVSGKIVQIDATVSDGSNSVAYTVINGAQSHAVLEEYAFSTLETAMQFILDAEIA